MNEEGIETCRTAQSWHQTVVHDIIKNSIYTGTGYANKEKAVVPKRRIMDKTKFRKYEKTGRELKPKDQWCAFNAPRIVSDEVFDLAQQQLEINRQRASRRTKKKYLLRSFLKCGSCGHRMIGQRGHYQCQYSRPAYARHRMQKESCPNKQRIPMNDLDTVIWEEVHKLLKSSSRLKEIYGRLGNKVVSKSVGNLVTLESKKSTLLKQLSRMNDLYVMGTFEINDYKRQYGNKKELLTKVENLIKMASVNTKSDEELKSILNSFKKFTETIKCGLDNADFDIKRRGVEEIIDFIEIKKSEIIINFAVPLRRKKSTLCSRTVGLDLISLTENNHSNSVLLSGVFDRNEIKYDLKMRCENANLFLRRP